MERASEKLMRNPSALAKFHRTGKLPTENRQPSEETPLRALISQIPVRYWSMFQGTTLSRELGFQNTAMRFANLHQLMRYIGFNKTVSSAERLPYQYYVCRSTEVVTLTALVSSSAVAPNEVLINKIRSRLPKHLY